MPREDKILEASFKIDVENFPGSPVVISYHHLLYLPLSEGRSLLRADRSSRGACCSAITGQRSFISSSTGVDRSTTNPMDAQEGRSTLPDYGLRLPLKSFSLDFKFIVLTFSPLICPPIQTFILTARLRSDRLTCRIPLAWKDTNE